MIKHAFIFLCPFIFLVQTENIFAENKISAGEELSGKLQQIKTLQGNFLQETFDNVGKLLQTQTGTFKIKNSGEFSWSISSPYEQKIISDGNTLKIYDPDLAQLTIKSVDKNAKIVPLLLFGGDSMHIEQEYKISFSLNQENKYELVPVKKDNLFENMAIQFNGVTPVNLQITDSMKQITHVRFEKIEINKTINAGEFEFQPPASVDMIDERKIDERKADERK